MLKMGLTPAQQDVLKQFVTACRETDTTIGSWWTNGTTTGLQFGEAADGNAREPIKRVSCSKEDLNVLTSAAFLMRPGSASGPRVVTEKAFQAVDCDFELSAPLQSGPMIGSANYHAAARPAMKRDMDLVRKILLAIEAQPTGFAPGKLAIDGHDEYGIAFHVLLMAEAGLLLGRTNDYRGKLTELSIDHRMTWEGYEFLEAARSDTVWDKAKRAAGASGGLAFAVLKATLMAASSAEAMKHLGLK